MQIALDVLTINEALEIAKKVADYVDILELGTPLLKRESADLAIRMMKANFPDKLILADLKTMDTGDIEAKIAFNAGADIMTVCAAANIETIKSAIESARKRKKEVVVDLIGIKNKAKKAELISKKLKPDYICVHTGIDERNTFPFSDLKKIKIRTKLSVAGGITSKKIKQVLRFNPSIIVIGRAITKSKDPREEARKIASIVRGKKIKPILKKPKILPKVLSLEKPKFKLSIKEIEMEIEKTLKKIDLKETNRLLEQIQHVDRIFITGQGRSGLIGQAFAMRLVQLGLNAFIVGGSTTPAVSRLDLLIAISGTGKTKATYDIIKKAKEEGAITALITTNLSSSMLKYADILIELKSELNGKEPLGSLFEQSTLLYLDSLIIELMKRLGKSNEEMRKLHSNL